MEAKKKAEEEAKKAQQEKEAASKQADGKAEAGEPKDTEMSDADAVQPNGVEEAE